MLEFIKKIFNVDLNTGVHRKRHPGKESHILRMWMDVSLLEETPT